MKFTDGYWLVRKGYTLNDPKEVYDVQIEDQKVTLYAPFAFVAGRGGTLNLGMLTLEIDSPLPGALHIRACHHKGGGVPAPSFEIRKGRIPLDVQNAADVLTVRSGSLSAVITKKPFSITYYEGETLLTASAGKGLSYVTGPEGAYMKEELALSVGETVYGLGERFTPFVKNGQTVTVWNEDGGTGSEQAYKNVPFYVTSRGYGVFVNNPGRVEYEIASEKVSRVQFSVAGEFLDYYLIGGGSMKAALTNYTALTGRPALPPKWSFGLWLSTSFTTKYDETTVLDFIDGMLERDIPLDVFHFDCCWMREFEWCNFEWYPEMFPDPAGLLTKIHERGVRVCCWINPYIAQKSKLFDEGMKKGYFLKRPDGSVWQWDLWQAGLAVVDFTNPQACKWYCDRLETLLDLGVDCFKTDFGERIPTDVVYYDGSDPVRMHNYYTQLYNQTVFELLERRLGRHEAVVFARCATAGGQKYPVHWGGDCTASYPSMAESLRGGLSLLLSGFGFWSHDIGGFEDGCEPDIYKRWTQFGLLSSHSRYHGSGQYKVPWLYGEEAVDVTRTFTELKLKLMPYLYSQAVLTHRTGIPLMRAMVLEFPEDETCQYLDRQYMLGDALLAAPVFSSTGEVRFYVPEGTWTHLLTGKKYAGGRWYREICDAFSLPLLVRENTALVTGPKTASADYDYTACPTITIYEIKEPVETLVYADPEQPPAKVRVLPTGEGLLVEARGFSGAKTVVFEQKTQVMDSDTILIS